MSPSFLITLVVALLAIFYWRVVVMVAIAVLLAFVLTGINAVSDVVTGQSGEPATVVVPAEPVRPPDEGIPAPADGTPADGDDPRAHEQTPPR